MSETERPENVNDLTQLGTLLRREHLALTDPAEPHTLGFPTIFGPEAPMFVRWEAEARLVLISQSLPLVVTAAQAETLAVTLLRINQQLDMVGLLADPARGVVWLRTHLYTDRQGRLDYPLFLTVVAACVQVVRDRLAELCVALGREPPPLAQDKASGAAADEDQAQALLAALRSFSE